MPVNEVSPPELLLPVPIGFDLVDKDGALLATVPGQITLAVSVEIQTTYATAPPPGPPDPRVYSAAFPRNIAREADIHR